MSALLGEMIAEPPNPDDIKALSERLEVVNLQLARRKNTRRKILHWICIALGAAIVMLFVLLTAWKSSYLGWNYGDPETAVMGTGFHALEWLFVRAAPIAFMGAIAGAFLTRKKGE